MFQSPVVLIAAVLTGLLAVPVPAQTPPEFKLVPAGLAAKEELGASSAVVGDLAVFGAPQGTGGGAVYVYRKAGGLWVEEQRFTGSDTNSNDQFGLAVSTDGTHIAVGAPWYDGNVYGGGAAYVFSHDGTAWVEDQKLTASDGPGLDTFGTSVAISGSKLVVGSPRDDDDGSDSGSAYVFEDQGPGTGWVEVQKLTASDATAGSRFGESCALSGSHLLVGAILDDEAGTDSGAVYAFEDAGGLTETQKLLPATNGKEWFGFSAAIQGNRAVVGAPQNNVSSWGSGYVFEHDGTQWVQQARLEPRMQGLFGLTVALDQDLVLLGAPAAQVQSGFAGQVSVYEEIGGSWYQSMRIAAKDGASSDNLGSSVALSDGYALMGAEQRDEGGMTSTGAIYGQTLDFTLVADPATPQAGDTLTLSAFSGIGGAPLMLAVIQVDGAPTFLNLVFTTFDVRNRFDLSSTVPAGLSGISIALQAYKLAARNGIEPTNVAVVSFQ